MHKEEKKSWVELIVAVAFVFGLIFLFGTLLK